jgi:glycosyltransferase 2 family protein
MKRRLSRSLGATAAFGVSALLLFLALRGLNWANVVTVLSQADVGWLMLGAALGMTGFVVRSFEWHYLLQPAGQVGGWRLFTPVAVGYTANNLLPARAGEFVRAYLVGKRESVSKTIALGTIFVERVIDLSILLLILVVLSLLFPYADWVRQASMLLSLAFVGLCLVAGIALTRVNLGVRAVDATLGRFVPKLANTVNYYLKSFVHGFDLSAHLGCLAAAVGLTGLRWLLEALMYAAVLQSVGLFEQVPVHGVFVLMVAVNIACIIPQAPSFIGSVQFASIEVLALFGVSRDEAAAFSVLIHLTFVLPITLTGLVLLGVNKLGLGEVARTATKA